MAEIKLLPCPFCGNKNVEIKDYTDKIYGFWDYKIVCSCGAYFNSPSTAIVDFSQPHKMVQTRNEETKKSAYDRMIIGWNTRTPTEKGGD